MKCFWLVFFIAVTASLAVSHSANKIWFEFRQDGRYRVYVNYTVPAIREFREAYVDFYSKKEAERFYWSLVKGGDFHFPDPNVGHFHEVPKGPDPW